MMFVVSTGVRIALCAATAVLLIKVASDRQQLRWHPKKLPSPEEQKCPDIILGPEPRVDWPNWAPFAEVLAEEVAEADEGEGFDAVFYGDSITEQWRGSAVGSPYPSMKLIHEVFDAHFNKNYTSHVLAVAGDQVGHLWWRLLNGELPLKKQPKAAVVLIGTNDLTADDCQESETASLAAAVGIVSRVRQMLWLMRSKLPGMHVILLGILPRDAHVLSGPPTYEWPNRMTEPIALANYEYAKMAEVDEKVHFLDCGAPYIKGKAGLDPDLLPDALHPNTRGMEEMAKCVQPLLDNLVLAPTPSAALASAQGV